LLTGSPEPIDGRLVGLQLRLDRFGVAHSFDESRVGRMEEFSIPRLP
jgi:hypothetical protein